MRIPQKGIERGTNVDLVTERHRPSARGLMSWEAGIARRLGRQITRGGMGCLLNSYRGMAASHARPLPCGLRAGRAV